MALVRGLLRSTALLKRAVIVNAASISQHWAKGTAGGNLTPSALREVGVVRLSRAGGWLGCEVEVGGKRLGGIDDDVVERWRKQGKFGGEGVGWRR